MKKEIKAKIDSLRHSINEHNYAYYVLDNPVLSDQEYDSLFRELEKLEKETDKKLEKTQNKLLRTVFDLTTSETDDPSIRARQRSKLESEKNF